jgi:hypothetical protein
MVLKGLVWSGYTWISLWDGFLSCFHLEDATTILVGITMGIGLIDPWSLPFLPGYTWSLTK